MTNTPTAEQTIALLSQIIAETAEELGCENDNEAILQAIHDLKQRPSLPSPPVSGEALQDRVKPWMTECFGEEISADKLERGDRHLEEVLELLQSGDYPRERVAALTDYVYNRPKGEPSQEVGGVMITLAAYCLAHGLDMHDAGEVELARIDKPEIIAKIRAKQAAKPTGSALPIALSPLTSEPVGVTRIETAHLEWLVNEFSKGHFTGRKTAVKHALDFLSAAIGEPRRAALEGEI